MLNSRLLPTLILGLLLAFGSATVNAFSTVIIDAGHGGHDRGGIPSQRLAEKHLALDVAKRLEKNLRRAGFRTVMTRRTDRFISLGQRVSIASKYRDAIFVSVHFNSSTREGARGFETFYYGSRSAGLASRIQNNIMRVTRTENRGVKRRGFYVLRKNRLPAVLVECGFLTNKKEARQAKGRRYRDRMANQIARGIIQHHKAQRGSKRSHSVTAGR